MVPDSVLERSMRSALGTNALTRLAACARPALESGHRAAIEAIVASFAEAAADRSLAEPNDIAEAPDVEDALAIMRVSLAALDGCRVPIPAATGSDEFLRELRMALPLSSLGHNLSDLRALTELPVPAISGSRGALWRLTRSILALDAGDPSQRPRLIELAAAYRSGSFVADCAERREHEDWAAWMAMLARLGWITRDLELCALTCEALSSHVDQMVVLGSFLPIAPVGWFLAEPLALLGRSTAAMAANRHAERVSGKLRSRVWVARCRLQRRQLTQGLPQSLPTAPLSRIERAAGPAQPVDAAPSLPDLTDRQWTILVLAAQGQTNAQIAKELFISVATVERHSTITYRKLGVRNRAQALGLLARHTR